VLSAAARAPPHSSGFRHVLVASTRHEQARRTSSSCCSQGHGNVCVVGDSDSRSTDSGAADIRTSWISSVHSRCHRCHVGAELPVHPDHLDAANGDRPQLGSGAPSGCSRSTTSATDLAATARRNEYDEASFVASEIFRLRNAEQLAFGDVAIFYTDQRPEAEPSKRSSCAPVFPTRSSAARVSRPPGDQGHPRLRPAAGQPR